MKSICLIVISTFLLISTVSATGGRHSNDPADKPTLEVVFQGVEGDFLLFTVKAEKVVPKTTFTIRNEAGDDIYREWHTEANSIRRVRIPRTAARTVHFVLGNRKQQCIKTFTINTNIIETVQVKELAR